MSRSFLLDYSRHGAYSPDVASSPNPRTVSGAKRQSYGKHYRSPASGAERVRRDAFGREWGSFAQQVSRQLRREDVK